MNIKFEKINDELFEVVESEKALKIKGGRGTRTVYQTDPSGAGNADNDRDRNIR